MIKQFILIFFTVMAFTACGGGGSSSSPSSNTAYLIDASIAGADYKTNSKSGVTGNDGSFSYEPTDTLVTFSLSNVIIGRLELSNLNSDKKVLPTDLAGVSRDDTSNEQVLKIIRFVQSMDSDQNPYNGIEITSDTKNKIKNSNSRLDLSKSTTSISEVEILVVNTVKKDFVSEQKAKEHFEKTLKDDFGSDVDTVAPVKPFLTQNIIATSKNLTSIELNGEANTKIYVNGNYAKNMDDNGKANLSLETNASAGKKDEFNIKLEDESGKFSEALIFSILKDTVLKDIIAPSKPSLSTTIISTTTNTTEVEINGEINSEIWLGSTSQGVRIEKNGKKKISLNTSNEINNFSIFLRDKAGNKSDPLTFTITNINITPVPASDTQAPIVDSSKYANINVDENLTTALTLEASDDTRVLYSISDISDDRNADKASFEIGAITGILTFKNAPDYDTGKKQYKVLINLTDGKNPRSHPLIININDVNENPIFTSPSNISVNENQTSVLTVEAKDETSISYSLVAGNDANYFSINSSTGVLIFTSNPDFEAKANHLYKVSVKATDSTNLSTTQLITININDLNENPIFTSSSSVTLMENIQEVLTLVTKNDAGESVTYSVSGGADANLFQINTLNKLAFKVAPDYEASPIKRTFNVQVQANDSTLTTTQNIVIDITNQPETVPTLQAFSGAVNENSTPNTSVGTMVLSSGDTNVTKIVLTKASDGSAVSEFNINTAGLITVATGAALDYETKNSYSLAAVATNVKGDSTKVNVTINLIDVAEMIPVIEPFSVTINENLSAGSKIGDITITRRGDSSSTPLSEIRLIETDNTDNTDFSVNTNGEILIASGAKIDYETKKRYDLKAIAVNAAGDSIKKDVTIVITDLADTPPSLNMFSGNIFENESSGANVGLLRIDSLGDRPITSIVLSGAGSSNFKVSTSGQITTAVGVNLDYESVKVYNLSAIASNISGNSAPVNVKINILDRIDTPPTIDTFSTTVDETKAVSSKIGTIPITNAGDSAITSITITGTGSEKFSINISGELSIASALDYETVTSYSLTMYATNTAGNSASKALTIAVNNIGEIKPILDVFTGSVNENSSNNVVVGSINISQAGDTPITSISLTGENSNYFAVDTSGQITTTVFASLDKETKGSYTYNAIATNGAGSSEAKAVTINITDVNEVPVITTNANISINENITTAVDVDATSDAGETLAFSITGGANSSAFTINGATGVLTFNTAPDYEISSQRSYVVEVTVSDGTPATLNGSKTFTITINDVDDTAPNITGTTPLNNTLNVNASNNLTVTFDEVVKMSTLTDTNITLTNLLDNSTISLAIGFNDTTRVATLNPSVDLTNNTFYKLELSTAIEDVAGNSLANTYTINFLVGNQIVGTSKDKNDQNVDTTYNVIKSPISGKLWLDRNLGASQACTSSSDNACYGYYFQWGRLDDGHQISDSNVNSSKANDSSNAGNQEFISSSDDWSTDDANGSKRLAQWTKSDGTSICPNLFKVPTKTELEAETTASSIVNGSNGKIKVISAASAYSNFLKIPTSGRRSDSDGSMISTTRVSLWTAAVDSGDSKPYYLDAESSALYSKNDQAFAMPVRCMFSN